VADAHAVWWRLALSSRPGKQAQSVLNDIDAGYGILVIPAVALAEMMMIVEKARLPIPPSVIQSSIRRWRRSDNIWLTNLTPEIVFKARKLTAIPEIFDRLIVAETLMLKAPLITIDAAITQSKLVKVIW